MSYWYTDNSQAIGNTRIPLAFLAAARGLPLTLTNVGKTIVVVSDSVGRYLSSPLFEGMFDASGMAS
ncbi:MAG: hypothetical protein NTV43_17365 [Methylococcales bacterium]|nr:hypothetical protein [Methylococcales bacterium]